MLTTVGLKATDGAGVDYGREWSPYVTLRGGWLFGGDAKGDVTVTGHPENNGSLKENIKSAWSGSGEFGVSFCEDRVSVGLELGYFSGTGKTAFTDDRLSDYSFAGVCYLEEGDEGYCRTDGRYKNLFAAVNVTLKKDVNERAFVYGGIGAGMVRSDFGSIDYRYHEYNPDELHSGRIDFKAKWRFLGQAFAGLGWYLNDNWSLTVGYRLRYLAGDGCASGTFSHDRVRWDWKVKQDLIHAAEIGVTWRF